MVLTRFYNEKLAQASYLVGCPACGKAAVIDPNRDIQMYLDAAKSSGVKIVAVTETHIHADYLSGSRELATMSGATLFLSAEGDEDWQYAFADEPNVTLVKHGDAIRFGQIRLDVVRTPGHTPEHISFVLTDEGTLDEPLGSFTGDFIFVGDVGRPDLLEKAAGVAGTMEEGAKSLFHSLQEFKAAYQSPLILWPGHGAGSACGKSMSGVPVSTLGYECKANWALKTEVVEDFVGAVLSGQPDPPTYFKQMKLLNKQGPPFLEGLRSPAEMPPVDLLLWLDEDRIVVDIRPTLSVSRGAVPGVLHVPNGKSFTNWAGWLLPYNRPIYFIADSQEQANEAAKDMAMIGLDEVCGWVPASALEIYAAERGSLHVTDQISIHEVAEASESKEHPILDVRAKSEFDHGHIPGAINIPLGRLSERIDEVPKGKRLIVHCAGGTRSMIALTVLAKHGITDARNMPDGFMDYEEAGLKIEAGPS